MGSPDTFQRVGLIDHIVSGLRGRGLVESYQLFWSTPVDSCRDLIQTDPVRSPTNMYTIPSAHTILDYNRWTQCQNPNKVQSWSKKPYTQQQPSLKAAGHATSETEDILEITCSVGYTQIRSSSCYMQPDLQAREKSADQEPVKRSRSTVNKM